MANQEAFSILSQVAIDLTSLFQAELTTQGLVESGRLRDSVKWIVIPTTDGGFTLQMESLDYFKFLDDKFNISQNVFNSSTYANIQEQIANAYSLIILDDLFLT